MLRKALGAGLVAATMLMGATVQAAEVKIGFVTTLTPPAGVIGRDMKDAFNLGLQHIGG